jgi:hypothetical protein
MITRALSKTVVRQIVSIEGYRPNIADHTSVGIAHPAEQAALELLSALP